MSNGSTKTYAPQTIAATPSQGVIPTAGTTILTPVPVPVVAPRLTGIRGVMARIHDAAMERLGGWSMMLFEDWEVPHKGTYEAEEHPAEGKDVER